LRDVLKISIFSASFDRWQQQRCASGYQYCITISSVYVVAACVCSHYCVVNRTRVEYETAKCSRLDHMALLGSTLDRHASHLDRYTDTELTAKFDAWIKDPDSSPDCVFYRSV